MQRNAAGHLGDNGMGVRIPVGDDLPRLGAVAVIDRDHRPIRHPVAFLFPPLRVDQPQLAGSRYGHVVAAALVLDDLDVMQADMPWRLDGNAGGSRGAAASSITIKSPGHIRLHNIKIVKHESSGNNVAVSRSGELGLIDSQGREKERYRVPYGAVISVNDGDRAEPGQIVANWDPHTHPIITEVAGRISLHDFIEGITVNKQIDEVTGLSSRVISDPKTRGSHGKDLRPMVRLSDENGVNLALAGTDLPAQYALPPGAIINLADGAKVDAVSY